MKFIFVLLSIIVCEKCNNTTADVPVFYRATLQRWSGGAAGSGNGVYYNIYINLPSSKIQFDSLWVGGKRIAVNIVTSLTSNDTTVVHGELFNKGERPYGNENLEPDNQTVINMPVETTSEAVLGFYYNNQRGYLMIEKFTSLPMLAYP